MGDFTHTKSSRLVLTIPQDFSDTLPMSITHEEIASAWLRRCGESVRAERGEQSQAELAAAAGVSSPLISLIESGAMNPSPRVRLAIADALDVEPAELWGWPTLAEIRGGAA